MIILSRIENLLGIGLETSMITLLTKPDLSKISTLTVAEFNNNFEDKSELALKKLDEFPARIIAPNEEAISLSK